MGFELNDMSGMLFKNDRQEHDRQPSHQGSIKINGVEYWMSAWVKEGKNGKFFSMAFQEKDNQPSGTANSPNKNAQSKPASSSGMDDFDEDISF